MNYAKPRNIFLIGLGVALALNAVVLVAWLITRLPPERSGLAERFTQDVERISPPSQRREPGAP